MTGHLWHQYWSWTGGNIGAMPLEALITVAATAALARPLRWLWHRLVGDSAGIEDLKRLAEAAERQAAAAHRIAADLFEHHTGEQHPLAPGAPEEDRHAP